MYLRAAKTEAIEAGESVEGMADSTSELREEILALTGNRVDLMADDKNFKSTYQILKELSEVWDSLTDVSQANILEMIGGKRNANVVSALLENFSLAEEVLETSMDSSGSALAENEKYLESIQGHISQFKAAFEALSETTINSDLVKEIIDIGTAFLETANSIIKFVDETVGLETAIKAILGLEAANLLGGLFDKTLVLSEKQQEKFDKFGEIVQGGINGIYSISVEAMDNGISFFDVLISKVGKTKIALLGLVAVAAMVSGLFGGYLKHEEQLDNNFHSDHEKFENESKSIKKYKSEVSSLKDILEDNSSSVEDRADAEERLLEIQDDLISTYGEDAKGLNLLKLSSDEAAEALDNLIKKRAEFYLSENKYVAKKYESGIEGQRTFSASAYSFGIDKDFVSKMQSIAEANGISFSKNLGGEIEFSFRGDPAEAAEKLKAFRQEVHELENEWFLDDKDANADVLLKSIDGAIAQAERYTTEFGDGYKKLKDFWAAITGDDGSSGDQESSLIEASRTFDSYVDSLSAFKTEQSALTNALKEQGGAGTLTLETYKALVAESENYATCLEYENGVMRINADAANAMLEAKMLTEALDIEGQIIKESAQYEANAKEIAKLNARYKSLSDDEKSQLETLKNSQVEIQKTIQQYSLLRAELLNMNSAYSKWKAAQDMPETGDMYDEMKTAAGQINDALKTGKTGTLKYQTAVEMLVTLEDPSPKQVQDYMKKLNRYITDDSSGAKNFINDMINKGLMESSTGGRATWNDAWLKDASMTIDEICNIMEITPTMAKAIFGELEEYHFDFRWDEDDFNNVILEEQMRKIQEEVERYKKALADNPKIAPEIDSTTLDNYVAKVTEVTNKLKELNDKGASSYDIAPIKEEIEALLSEGLELGIDLESVGFTEEFLSGLGLDIQTADVQAQLTAVAGNLDNIAAKITAVAAMAIGDLGAAAASNMLYVVYSRLQDIQNFSIDDKTFNVTALVNGGSGSSSGNGSSDKPASARGTLNASGGRTLVGELGRELVVSNGRYYTVGDKGAEFVNLKKGDIVFNHIDTERILGMSSKTHQGQAFAGGTFGKGSIADQLDAAKEYAEAHDLPTIVNIEVKPADDGKTEKALPPAQDVWETVINPLQSKNDTLISASDVMAAPKSVVDEYLSGGKTDLSDGSGTGGPSPEELEKNFEEQYKEHQHLLAMDKESTAEYLDWLEGAYKLAFEEGTEEYWKYEEEVYKGRQDLFKDSLGDKEHFISMLVADDADASTIINNYEMLIKSVEAELERAYAQGLDDNDDYVQELKDKLVDYKDEIKSINDDINEDAKDSYEDLIEYRKDMLKQELENEKDALSERINTLQDFYEKQKDMLQDAYDEEEYLEEQADKRRIISDLEDELNMLKNDDSAYAQRRKLEIEEELADAREDLADFEKEHALKITQDMLDKQLELQENVLNSEIDKIDEKLEDQKGLRDQAIADLQNGDLALYEAMIAYNNIYGDGNTNTIKTMWEDAYVAMQKYFELYNQYYEGMQLQNVTGYIPIPVGQGYASGTYSATPGVHEIEEYGSEYIFKSSDGRRFRMFGGGEKVLNATATDFLYKFANSGGKILENMISRTKTALPSNAVANNRIYEIKTGDIIVHGNTTERTVSEIRRAQRENVDFILKELGRLQNR